MKRTQVAPLASRPQEPEGGEPREEPRVRGPSVQPGARRGLGRKNGGRVEEDDMRTRAGRPRGLGVSTRFFASRARTVLATNHPSVPLGS